MAQVNFKKGTTSKLARVFIQNSSTGAAITGLVYNSSGLQAYYTKEGDSSTTLITLATATVGTWSSGGFKEVDATNMPGIYEIGIPNAAIASGNSTVIYLTGYASMAPCVLMLQLDATNNQDAVAGGMSAFNQVITQYPLHKNTAYNNFGFYMVASSDHVTPKTGSSVSGQVSLDGAAFANLTNSVTEIASGWYKVNLAAADLNGTEILIKFTAGSTDPVNIKIPLSA